MDDFWCSDNIEVGYLSDDEPCPESNIGESQGSVLNNNTDSNLEINKDLENFIEKYESLPQLWNPTHPGYMKKDVRNNALDKILPIYRKIKHGANRADVRRKIDTLRSNYRKELKRILDSKRSGCGTDEVYVPTSWVFHALKFLNKYEKPVNSSSSIRQSDESTENDVQEDLNIEEQQNELLQMACNYLQQSNSKTDKIPTIAIAWGETLMSLDPQQRIFAERAIGEVLCEARLGKLDRYSVKINEHQ